MVMCDDVILGSLFVHNPIFLPTLSLSAFKNNLDDELQIVFKPPISELCAIIMDNNFVKPKLIYDVLLYEVCFLTSIDVALGFSLCSLGKDSTSTWVSFLLNQLGIRLLGTQFGS